MNIKLNIKHEVPDYGVKTINLYLYKQVFATFTSCLISLCSGMTFGITAVMLPQLRQDKSIQYYATYDSWIASSASLAMIFGSLACGPVLDNFGRKAAHIILGIPFIIGWIFIACASSINFIIVGRVLTGFSSGANKAVTLVYIGEIANPKFRSWALFLPTVTSHIGTIFSHIVGNYLAWKLSAIVCMVPMILACIIFMFLKESPLWLIAKGRTDEGIENFRWFRGTDEASEEELKIVLERQAEKPKISIKETVNTMCSLSFIKPMLLLMVLMLNMQFSGMNVIIFYSEDIFERVFSGNVDVFLMMMAMDCLRSVISFSICFLGKCIPKKIALLTSSFGVSISILVLVTCTMLKLESVSLRVLCLVLYIALSSTIVTIGWTFVPELLPNNARGLGAGLNSAFIYILLFIIVKVAPDLMNMYSESALFGVCGISTFVCGFILIFVLPETTGKTLQSIEDSYNRKATTKSDCIADGR